MLVIRLQLQVMGLPITETQFKAAMATTMEQQRQMDSSPADKIPGILASAETLKEFGSSWVGESAQVAFGAGLGSIAGTGGAGGGGVPVVATAVSWIHCSMLSLVFLRLV